MRANAGFWPGEEDPTTRLSDEKLSKVMLELSLYHLQFAGKHDFLGNYCLKCNEKQDFWYFRIFWAQMDLCIEGMKSGLSKNPC